MLNPLCPDCGTELAKNGKDKLADGTEKQRWKCSNCKQDKVPDEIPVGVGSSLDLGENDAIAETVWTSDSEIITSAEIQRKIELSNPDPKIWKASRIKTSSWPTKAKHKDKDLKWEREVDTKGNPVQIMSGHSIQKDEWVTTWNHSIKIEFTRKTPTESSIEQLLKDLRNQSSILYKPVKYKKSDKFKRDLEVSIMDPHISMLCFAPQSDCSWSPDKAVNLYKEVVDRIVLEAQYFGPFEKVVYTFGNDFLHADNGKSETTHGTLQPEAVDWHESFLLGKELMIWTVDRLLEVAPVKVYAIHGNHDNQTSFALGQVLEARFHNYDSVDVDASADPFKYHKAGINLIGFTHQLRQQVRLAALMANDNRENGWWSEAKFCEWHLGDQHRKGSSKPIMLEEQGVSVEYLPGLTPPNSWHRKNTYNYQKRAGLGYIWDYKEGLKARLNVNIDSYTNKIMS